MKEKWLYPQLHDSDRSLRIVRIVVALILITHPAYALLHPANVRGFGHILESHDIPLGTYLAWVVMLIQVACSVALLIQRQIVAACLGHIFVLIMGIFLIHAPKWRTVGLPDGDHQPGSEFSVLLIACLLSILWADRDRTAKLSGVHNGVEFTNQALEFVRIASASILIVHPIGGLRDPAGLNDLGLYFSSIGFPFGVQLVWGSMFLQIASSLALIARCLVVPACLGHMLVLFTGVWLFHRPYWFVVGPHDVVGPGHEGIEYSTLLITCFISTLIAYWPKTKPVLKHSYQPETAGSLNKNL
jgi:uncharacterized membrane protein YphA (DoxX/SURF4 family)